jgi:anti-sigma B factor antagonist
VASRPLAEGASDGPHNRSLFEEGSTIRTSSRKHDPSALRVDVHPRRDSVHVVAAGELDVGNVAALHAQLSELRGAGVQHVVLDLRELTFMDSAGVRLILDEDRLARSSGRRFSLIKGVAAVQRVLNLCGVSGHLDFGEARPPVRSRGAARGQARVERSHMGIAFQIYIAELRRQGRAASGQRTRRL